MRQTRTANPELTDRTGSAEGQPETPDDFRPSGKSARSEVIPQVWQARESSLHLAERTEPVWHTLEAPA
jgi:hypothetical protein